MHWGRQTTQCDRCYYRTDCHRLEVVCQFIIVVIDKTMSQKVFKFAQCSCFTCMLTGVVQVLLARFGCANYENAEVYTCPLSKSFNHNAVIHILLATDAGIFFVAEFLSIRHRRTMTSCSWLSRAMKQSVISAIIRITADGQGWIAG